MIFGLAMIKHGVPKVKNTYSKIGVLKVANILFSSVQIITMGGIRDIYLIDNVLIN